MNALEGSLERHRLGGVANRQVAGDLVLVPLDVIDLSADELHDRMVLGIEEIGRAQVVVARLLSRIDAGDTNLDVDLGIVPEYPRRNR